MGGSLGAVKAMPWWGWCGAAVIAVGAAVLAMDVPGLNTAWFLFAWVGALLLMDAGIELAGGRAFLRHRRGELAAMTLWSIPYWCLFEAYNLRLQNWWYVFVPASEVGQGLLAALAFATVLPACFVPAALLGALGLFDGVRWRPLAMTAKTQAAIGLFGLACIAAPLVWPRQAFALVWGATFGLPALIVYRANRPEVPSLLRDLVEGRPARWLQLLAGGLIAGGLWEGLNWPARARWIYTVPGLEELKLFEMPLLGFLGFPALAVEAAAAWHLWLLIRRRGWGQRVAMAGIVGFSVLCSAITMEPQLIAARPLLAENPYLDAAAVERLAEAGWSTPERLEVAVWALGAEAVAERAGLPAARVDRAADHAALAVHKGMGSGNATLLQAVGVRHPGDLRGRRATILHGGLMIEASRSRLTPPPVEVVAVWIRAAEASNGAPHR